MLIKKKREPHKDLKTELVARLLDRAESEGVISSPSSELWTAPKMVNGFLCRVEKFNEGWQGLAYKKVPDKKNGGFKEVQIDKLPMFSTRERAERALYKVVNGY
jgi:hypothetical protein